MCFLWRRNGRCHPTLHQSNPTALSITATDKLSYTRRQCAQHLQRGSFFRTADGAGGISHLYLCGFTPTPDNPKVAKTALGAETSVAWTYHKNSWKRPYPTTTKLSAMGLRRHNYSPITADNQPPDKPHCSYCRQ